MRGTHTIMREEHRNMRIKHKDFLNSGLGLSDIKTQTP
jgi:hypothetical protein